MIKLELVDRNSEMVQSLQDLIRAGMCEVVIVDGKKSIRQCNPQFINCTWCPWVSITDYFEYDGDAVQYSCNVGEIYSLPKSGFCNLTGDVLLNFDELPECKFLKKAKEGEVNRVNRRKERECRRKVERQKDLVQKTKTHMDVITNSCFINQA